MDELLPSYKKALRETWEIYKQLGDQRENDKKIVHEMISDLEYSIAWMENRRMPGLRRPASRKSRVIFKDPDLMARIYTIDHAAVPNASGRVTGEEIAMINECLSILTDRQREMFVMHEGEGFSYERIAELLGVTKATVQTTITRSRAKIQKYVNSNLVGGFRNGTGYKSVSGAYKRTYQLDGEKLS
ncbi:sigma-70 family RNA polymerase sigma factor [Bacillus paralicheniformis]|uniref:Sigma-70 family RNA polymerase sigma factor n=1 Tax=Bacillus glycinifermentans TaxID=1664069 RepID=A0A0T6BQT0_9BACI|nr:MULTISPECIES: sigma-70 family RNA polymerase sigma factor [Bacillus]KRT94009.1 hypothetical protein AB447_215290 [Bacillus glycinifermentans]MCV9368934.1 sigma-70 family RNA polymerase sigma factor [Bacillus paralicheniformis]MEC0487394.1 sigma-70 family RNA polymerase sigma factor [Bacillus glycinifermentans]WIG07399.1 sigma-70 family RNA polymerase sigma factor [Bacillus paralicheniformis]